MKQKTNIIFLLTVLMSMVFTKAFAYDIAVDNTDGVTIYYNWIKEKTELQVTSRYSYSWMGTDVYTDHVEIPEFVEYEGNTYIVSSIGVGAFQSSENLVSVTIPNSVEYIGSFAFCDCKSLISVIIPNSVKSIGSSAFLRCITLASVTIGSSVETINGDAFMDCNLLSSVHIIDIKAWCNITFNGNYSNPLTLTKACHLFLKDSEIEDLVIPDGVTKIPNKAFYGCSSLKSVSIPSSVTSIGYCAFEGCTNLTKVHISDLESWLNISKDGICLSNYHLYIDEKEIKDLVIPDGVTSLGDNAFAGCTGLTSVTIPNSITSISSGAFSDCSGLTSFTIPNSVTSIGNSAFYHCTGLTSITIPNSVTIIYENAFWNCTGLKSITFLNDVINIREYALSVIEIREYAFYGCTGLTSVNIIDLEKWCKMNFSNVINTASNPLEYAHHLYLNGEEIRDLVIPDNVTQIGSGVFKGCTGIRTVTIPDNVTDIGIETFQNCTNLHSVNIGDGVTSIGFCTFDGCCSLTSITIPDNVTYIGGKAFQNCTGLTAVNISNNVTNIEFCAFKGCTGLTSVTIPNGVETIQPGVFYGCTNLKSITIPQSVTTIKSDNSSSGGVFENCISLTSVLIPENVVSIGYRVFNGCNNLKYIVFTSDSFTDFQNIGIQKEDVQFILPQSVYDKGISDLISNFVIYNGNPMYIDVKSKGATSAVLDLHPICDNGLINSNEIIADYTVKGLTPGKNISWKIDTENFGIISQKTEESLTLDVQEPKELSTKKARLLATVEEADDVEHYGFEWRRIESSDMIASKTVSAPLYNGTIVGTLNNLNPDVEYKYRPFYKSDSGEMFYGEWMGLFTGDANVFFEPEVYTKDATDITKVSALLAGFWCEGTDDFEEKGFEYWAVSNSMTKAVGSDVAKVVVSGNKMTATIEGLKAGTEYYYRSYAKTASGTTYGEEKTFRTILMGDVNNDGVLSKKDVEDLADYIMGKNPTGFNKKMADLNGDDKVNAADIVMLVDLLGK